MSNSILSAEDIMAMCGSHKAIAIVDGVELKVYLVDKVSGIVRYNASKSCKPHIKTLPFKLIQIVENGKVLMEITPNG